MLVPDFCPPDVCPLVYFSRVKLSPKKATVEGCLEGPPVPTAQNYSTKRLFALNFAFVPCLLKTKKENKDNGNGNKKVSWK